MPHDEIVRLLEVDGDEYLFFPRFPIDVALPARYDRRRGRQRHDGARGATIDSLAIAQAMKNSGGIVLAQVERVTARHALPPQAVQVPGILVDAIVVAARDGDHEQTFAEPYNPAYTGAVRASPGGRRRRALDERKVIARRAAMLLEGQQGRQPRHRDARRAWPPSHRRRVSSTSSR